MVMGESSSLALGCFFFLPCLSLTAKVTRLLVHSQADHGYFMCASCFHCESAQLNPSLQETWAHFVPAPVQLAALLS